MTIEELFDLLSQYEQVGFMQAVKAYEPTQDLVRLGELKAWLKMMQIDYKLFKALGIQGKRVGKAVNSPIYYSKKEIKSAIATSKVSLLIRNEELRKVVNNI